MGWTSGTLSENAGKPSHFKNTVLKVGTLAPSCDAVTTDDYLTSREVASGLGKL